MRTGGRGCHRRPSARSAREWLRMPPAAAAEMPPGVAAAAERAPPALGRGAFGRGGGTAWAPPRRAAGRDRDGRRKAARPAPARHDPSQGGLLTPAHCQPCRSSPGRGGAHHLPGAAERTGVSTMHGGLIRSSARTAQSIGVEVYTAAIAPRPRRCLDRRGSAASRRPRDDLHDGRRPAARHRGQGCPLHRRRAAFRRGGKVPASRPALTVRGERRGSISAFPSTVRACCGHGHPSAPAAHDRKPPLPGSGRWSRTRGRTLSPPSRGASMPASKWQAARGTRCARIATRRSSGSRDAGQGNPRGSVGVGDFATALATLAGEIDSRLGGREQPREAAFSIFSPGQPLRATGVGSPRAPGTGTPG